MRPRRATWAALSAGGLTLMLACNAILGIGAPELVSDGGAAHDAAVRDGSLADRTVADAARHDSAGLDAARDVHHDAGRDAAQGDAFVRDARPDAATDAAGAFDGNCSCTGDACAPITILANIPASVEGLALGPGGLYFTITSEQTLRGMVGFLRLGAGVTAIEADASFPEQIALGRGEAYWVDVLGNEVRRCTLAAGGGCGVPENFASTFGLVGDVAVNGATAVWSTNSNGMFSCPVTGCDGGASVPGTSGADQFVMNDAGVFWITRSPSSGGVAFCANAGCDAASTLVGPDAGVQGLAATAENLYWVDALGNLSTCPLPTCASPRVLVAGTVSATRLWVDATGIYWVGGSGGSIDKVGLDGGAPTVLASNAEQADRLAVGPTCVFWANFDPQAVRSSLNAIAK